MNIYQKLVEVRKAVPYLQKEAEGHQYKYVSSSQVLASVRRKMDEVGLMLMPSVTGKEVHVDGKNVFTELVMQFTWVNAEKPDEQIAVPWYGQGMDISGEKGVGKALTYAEKYFLLKTFNIATDKDDPDAFQQREEKKHNPAVKEATPQQRRSITTAVKALAITKQDWNGLLNTNGIVWETMTAEQAEKLITTLADYQPAQEAAH